MNHPIVTVAAIDQTQGVVECASIYLSGIFRFDYRNTAYLLMGVAESGGRTKLDGVPAANTPHPPPANVYCDVKIPLWRLRYW